MTDSETSKATCWKCGTTMDAASSFMGAGAAYCPGCGAYPADEHRKKKAKVVAILAIAVAAGILVLAVVRPGGPRTSTETSESAPRPPAPSIESPPAAPAPAIIAGPVNGDGLEVSIVGARRADSLTGGSSLQSSYSSGFSSDNRTQYTPKEGLTFLVVDVLFRNLDASRASIKVSSEEAAVIDKSGKAVRATGSGTERTSSMSFDRSSDKKDYCVGCKTSFEKSNVQKGIIEVSLSFVFVIRREAVNQVFKFRYNRIPPIDFAVSKPK